MNNVLTQIIAIIGAATGIGSIIVTWYLNTPNLEIEDSMVYDPDEEIQSSGKGTFTATFKFRNTRGGNMTIDQPKLILTTSVLERGKIKEYSSVHQDDDTENKFLEIPARGKVRLELNYTISVGSLVKRNYNNTKLSYTYTDNKGKEYIQAFDWGVSESEIPND